MAINWTETGDHTIWYTFYCLFLANSIVLIVLVMIRGEKTGKQYPILHYHPSATFVHSDIALAHEVSDEKPSLCVEAE